MVSRAGSPSCTPPAWAPSPPRSRSSRGGHGRGPRHHLQRHGRPAPRPRAGRRHRAARARHRHGRLPHGARGRPPALARVADEPAHGRHRARRRARPGPRARRAERRRQHPLDAAALPPALARRRRRRALGDEVPLGSQRRRARRHRRAGHRARPRPRCAPRRHRTLHGAVAGPMEVFLALRGLRTLSVRFERASATAAELARRLEAHDAVERVRYPGAGAILSIDVQGGLEAAERVCAATRLWLHSTSLGGVESQLERRRRHPSESEQVPVTCCGSRSASSTSTTCGPTSTRPSARLTPGRAPAAAGGPRRHARRAGSGVPRARAAGTRARLLCRAGTSTRATVSASRP